MSKKTKDAESTTVDVTALPKVKRAIEDLRARDPFLKSGDLIVRSKGVGLTGKNHQGEHVERWVCVGTGNETGCGMYAPLSEAKTPEFLRSNPPKCKTHGVMNE